MISLYNFARSASIQKRQEIIDLRCLRLTVFYITTQTKFNLAQNNGTCIMAVWRYVFVTGLPREDWGLGPFCKRNYNRFHIRNRASETHFKLTVSLRRQKILIWFYLYVLLNNDLVIRFRKLLPTFTHIFRLHREFHI